MTYREEKIRAVSEKKRKKAELEVRLTELKKERQVIKRNVTALEAQAHNEQIDVSNLEEKTLTSAIYDFLGKKEKKLDKERAEARDAIAKRDVALMELQEIDAKISSCESDIENCNAEFSNALTEILRSIRNSGISGEEYAIFLTETANACRDEMARTNDALAVSQNALRLSHEVLDELSEAEDLASFDVVGGGLLLKAQKHGRIDEAQRLYGKLQKEIELLKHKLGKIDIKPNVSIADDELMTVVDFIWDNFFTNWSIIEEIDGAQKSVQNLSKQISDAQKFIYAHKYDLELENEVLQSAVNQIGFNKEIL